MFSKMFKKIFENHVRHYGKNSNDILIKAFISKSSCNNYKGLTPLSKLDQLIDKNTTLSMTKKKMDVFYNKNKKKLLKFKITKDKHAATFSDSKEFYSKEALFLEKTNIACFKGADKHYVMFSWKQVSNNKTNQYESHWCIQICTSIKKWNLDKGKDLYKIYLSPEEVKTLLNKDVFHNTNGTNIVCSSVYNREIVLTDAEFMDLIFGNPRIKKNILKINKENFDKVVKDFSDKNIYWLIDSEGNVYSIDNMNNNKVKETEVSSLSLNKTALSKSKFKKFVDFKYALNVLDKYDSEKHFQKCI